MDNDRMILEKAAKAAEIEVRYQPMSHRFLTKKQLSQSDGYYFAYWDPLTDDGDALRLVVKLNMDIVYDFDRVMVVYGDGDATLTTEYFYDLPTPTDQYSATRRAIVRAAAAIGESMI